MYPMTVEAALDQLINIGHEFFVFREKETGNLLPFSPLLHFYLGFMAF